MSSWVTGQTVPSGYDCSGRDVWRFNRLSSVWSKKEGIWFLTHTPTIQNGNSYCLLSAAFRADFTVLPIDCPQFVQNFVSVVVAAGFVATGLADGACAAAFIAFAICWPMFESSSEAHT